jgi:hypothetical protein
LCDCLKETKDVDDFFCKGRSDESVSAFESSPNEMQNTSIYVIVPGGSTARGCARSIGASGVLGNSMIGAGTHTYSK